MGIQFWLVVVLTLVLGTGFFLLVPGVYSLARRAKALGMWPDRRDEPPYPWTIWHEWTFALLGDLFRRSDQRDLKYRQLQRRVRWGLALTVIGFAGIALLATLPEKHI